ncbi:MAG: nucleotidyltransferase domain-containing protein [Candidatus Asgardarchaeum sp.]
MIDQFILRILERISKSGECRFSDLLKVVENPRTLSRKLRYLISRKIIKSEKRMYKLTEKGKIVVDLLKKLNMIIEGTEIHIKNIERIPHKIYSGLLERYCKILCEHFGEKLIGVALFGSIARGDWNKDSDIDLLIIVDKWDKKLVWERIRELRKLKKILKETEEFKNALSKGYFPIIQHYPLSKEEAKRFHRVYIDICIDGIILYEKENFLTKTMEKIRQKLLNLGAKRIEIPNKGYYWVLADIKAGEVIEL